MFVIGYAGASLRLRPPGNQEEWPMSLANAEAAQPPSRLLLLMEGRALHELAAFAASLPLLRLSPRGDGHPVLVLPGLVASDISTRPLRGFLKDHAYAAHGWKLGRNHGYFPGLEERMVDRIRDLRGRYGRKAGARRHPNGDHARQSVLGQSQSLARLAAIRARQRISRRRPEQRVCSHACGAAPRAHHGDLQPKRRHLRLGVLRRETDGQKRKHRSPQQPLWARPQSGGGLCDRRPPRPARGRMEAVRPRRLARFRVSRAGAGLLTSICGTAARRFLPVPALPENALAISAAREPNEKAGPHLQAKTSGT